MLNLFTTRSSTHQNRHLARLLTRFPTHSLSSEESLYDPPFTPLPKPPKPRPPSPTPKPGRARDPPSSSLPFDFRNSYSETNPDIKPIGFREPIRFSPFGPGRLDRKWTGTCAPVPEGGGEGVAVTKNVEEERKKILGDPLDEKEVEELVERYRHNNCGRQINLGMGGVTHNMLDDIHNHWKRAEAVRIKCLGVPTLDMDNVCFHLEVTRQQSDLQLDYTYSDFYLRIRHFHLKSVVVSLQEKSGGKIIYRHINILLLYRGRNYDPKARPVIPLMLWKPYPPIYPRLVKNVADGLTFEETKDLRNRGLNSIPVMILTRNGVYVNVVDKVREAFKTEEVVRLDCTHMGMSDCKRIGVKLRDLVPCIPILFKDEQIILWRGKKEHERDSN